MLPVRHFRIWSNIAGLWLAGLLAVNHANAQAATAPTTAAAGDAPSEEVAAPAAASAPASPLPPVPPNGASPVSQQAGSSAASVGAEESEHDAEFTERDTPVAKPPSSTRWLLLATGAATTGLFYLGGLGIGEAWPDAPGKPDLKYPIAGPFMDLGQTGCPASDSGCSKFQLALRTVMISLDALGQVGGLALMLQGAVLGTASVDAPRGIPNAKLPRRHEDFAVVAVPWVDSRSGGGLSLTGRF